MARAIDVIDNMYIIYKIIQTTTFIMLFNDIY